MTPQEIQAYFEYHNANIRSVEVGFNEIRRQIKILHTQKNSAGTFIYTLPDAHPEKLALINTERALSRILSGIQVCWAEENIKRLLYESNLLTNGQRTFLLEQPSLEARWQKALHIVFAIAYGLVPPGDENCNTLQIENLQASLGNTLVNQYRALKRIIIDQLAPNFSIRNKVQHGQWVHGFRTRYSTIYDPIGTTTLSRENILTTTARQQLVNRFYQLIVDLGRFKSNQFAIDPNKTPFEYFYPSTIAKIKQAVNIIDTANLPQYIQTQIAKQIRGEQHKVHRQPSFFNTILSWVYKFWRKK